MTARLSHLARLESEAIHILREAVAEARKPVMLFSAGKDSTVLAYLALRAFFPGRPPFPLLHIDSTWEFQSLLDFRDGFAREHRFELIVPANEAARAAGLNPFDHGDRSTLETVPYTHLTLPTNRTGAICGVDRTQTTKHKAR